MITTIKEKIFAIFCACILVLLFLMSSTNLIIKEKKNEIYQVSVIVEDSKDDYYVNLKKGMDQAGVEHNIDVNFITLYERNNSEQQKDMLIREIDAGAQAIILSPVDYIKMASVLENMTVDIPIIILNNEELAGNKVMANVSMDYFAGGQKMADYISKEISSDAEVYLFTEGLQYGSNRRLYDGLMSVLGERYRVNLIEKAFKSRYTEVMAERVVRDSSAVVIALDTESLTEMAGIIELNQTEFGGIALYGPGTNLKILRYMEDGIIKGVLTENMYDAGYLSMEEAVEAIDNKNIKETVRLDSFFLEKSDIKKKEFEKMLYPIY
ncbi:MAG: substrate-binding domain-containing protein [Clostridium sp.]